MNKKLTIITLLIIFSSVHLIDAISAGVSPPKITIENAQPGNDYNLTFAVYNMGNQTTDYSIEIKGNISNWTYIDISKVQVKGNSNYPISGLIRVPSNTPVGNYTGSILIKSIPSSNISGNKVSVGVNLPITVNMSIANQTVKTQELNNSYQFLTLIILIVIIMAILFVVKHYTKNKEEGETK